MNVAEAWSPEAGSVALTRCRIGVAESGTVKVVLNDPSAAAFVSPTGVESNAIWTAAAGLNPVPSAVTSTPGEPEVGESTERWRTSACGERGSRA